MDKTAKKESLKKEYLSIDELKSEYEKLMEKYKLPEFSELNKLFDIEEIDLGSEFLLRKIRRIISEKIGGYMRFAEVILNPSNAPILFFKLIKKLDNNDKEILAEIYDILGNYEIEVIKLDLDYSEEKEAEFIKKVYKIFNEEIKGKLFEVVDKLGNGESYKKKEFNGSYFG